MARFYIIAGEASGDLHGSNLIRGLLSRDPSCEIRFCGGDAMAAAGGTMARHYRDTAVMGFVDVLAKAGKILSNLSFCKQDIVAYNPDALILIDYPGFNLRIARFASRRGLKVFWYIAPKVWARGEGRIRQLKRYVDRLFIIFPFEKEYFRKHGIDAVYVGNPLMDSVAAERSEAAADGRTVALLPGSRQAELRFLMPRYVRLAKLAACDPRFEGVRFEIACAPSLDDSDYLKYMPEDCGIKLTHEGAVPLLKRSAAAVICSGTASLEAAIAGTPQVVCYGFDRLTYLLARLTVRSVRYISLANLILDKEIFPELIQDKASPEALRDLVAELLGGGPKREAMLRDYSLLAEELGSCGASSRLADEVLNSLNHSK